MLKKVTSYRQKNPSRTIPTILLLHTIQLLTERIFQWAAENCFISLNFWRLFWIRKISVCNIWRSHFRSWMAGISTVQDASMNVLARLKTSLKFYCFSCYTMKIMLLPMIDVWHMTLWFVALETPMMESELSLRGVGNQMLPFLLLITSGSSWSRPFKLHWTVTSHLQA